MSSKILRLIPQPVVAHQTAKFSCCGQYLIFGPASHVLDSFPELFTVEKGITGRSLIIKANETKIGKFGLNESLLKFFNLPGYTNSKKDYFRHIKIDNVSNPKNYFINCDLIEKQQSLLNGKPSSLLACFDIRGKPYERIHYQNTHLNVLRDVSTGNHVSNITLSVTDETNRLLNFNRLPLQFQIEIN